MLCIDESSSAYLKGGVGREGEEGKGSRVMRAKEQKETEKDRQRDRQRDRQSDG